MKKTYLSPASLTVQLGTCKMMAQSLAINSTGASISNSSEILVKEQDTPSDVNIWDEEW